MSAVRLCTCVLSAAIAAGLLPHTIDTAAAELPAINDIARRYGESIGRLQTWWVRYETSASRFVGNDHRIPVLRGHEEER